MKPFQVIEKNTKNIPPPPHFLPPPKKAPKTQNSPRQRAIPPIKILCLTTIIVSSRIYVQNFIRNQTVFKK